MRGLAGDGGPATSARLDDPHGVALTADGGFLIADTGNARVRKVAPDGTISTVAGTSPGFSGDGGRATTAQLAAPADVIPLTNGGFLIADTANNRLRRVTPSAPSSRSRAEPPASRATADRPAPRSSTRPPPSCPRPAGACWWATRTTSACAA